jgi:phenylalanyl-tRNA synthetase beta subunit
MTRNIKNKSYKYMKNIRIKDIFIDKDKLQLNRYITLELCLQSVDKTLSDEDINKAIINITQDIKKIYKLNIQEAQ